MNIFVVNLGKMRHSGRVLLTCIAVLLLCAVGIFSVRAFFDSNALYASAEPLAGRVIILDAGHGGEDPGAIGVGGVYEKDLNLQIALELGEQLEKEGFVVVYTRTTDKMLYSEEENIKGMRKLSDLKNRCAIANNYEDAILVSIHMNSFGASKYSGLQVYYASGNQESQTLATKVQSSVKNNLQNNNSRQIKNGKDLYILDNSNPVSILVECGFLSNEEECKKLSEKEYQKQLSFAIVCGIIEYIEKNSPAE